MQDAALVCCCCIPHHSMAENSNHLLLLLCLWVTGASLIQPGLGWAALVWAAAARLDICFPLQVCGSVRMTLLPPWTNKLARTYFSWAMAEVQEGKQKCARPYNARSSQTVTELIYHWPVEVTWLHPKSEGTEAHCACSKALARVQSREE